MIIKKTKIKDAYILKTKKYRDNRGYFEKQFSSDIFKKKRLNVIWKQINKSFNEKNILLEACIFKKNLSGKVKLFSA